jgi:hypothetical protein
MKMSAMFHAAVVGFAVLFGVKAMADDKPVLATPGKLLFEDDFSHNDLKTKWKVGKGFFAVEDGVVRVTENPEDHHGAYFKANFPYKDVVAEFSFKLEGSKSFNFTMDDNKYKGSHAGHICRAMISANQVQLGDSKFGVMRNDVHEKMTDPKTTPEEKKKVQASIKDKAATFKVHLDAGKWHQGRVEVVGDEMLVSIDGKPVGYLKSEGVDHATKNLLGFTVSGKSTLLDNVKVWAAKASPDWQSQKSEVLASLGK